MTLDTTIGGAASDSYATLADYQAYAAAQGWTLADTDAANEVNLRRAALVLDTRYTFRGTKQTREQAREWPRATDYGFSNDYIFDPYPIIIGEIPARIKTAQMELAHVIQQGTDPLATIEASTTKDMIKVGPITLDEETVPTGTPRLVAVEGLLRPYLKAGAGQVALVRG